MTLEVSDLEAIRDSALRNFDERVAKATAKREDIEREAVGEIVPTKESKTAIGRNTAIMLKKLLNDRMRATVAYATSVTP